VNEKREKLVKAGRDLLQSSIDIVSGKIAHLHLFNDIMKEEVDEKINAALDSLDELEPHLTKDFPNFEIKLFHPSLFMKREVYTPLDPVEKFQSAEEVIETNDMARAITKNISDFTTQPDSPHLSASQDKHSGSGSFSPFEAVEDDRSAKTPPHEENTNKDSSSKHSKTMEEKTQTTSKTSKNSKANKTKKTSKKRKESKTRTGKVKTIKKKVKKVLKEDKKSKEKTKKKSNESKNRKKKEKKERSTVSVEPNTKEKVEEKKEKTKEDAPPAKSDDKKEEPKGE
ncbi:hypothetical protein PMAYCL1PPCAC_02083, partial [Pristionchus mayeri]